MQILSIHEYKNQLSITMQILARFFKLLDGFSVSMNEYITRVSK